MGAYDDEVSHCLG